MRINLGGSGDTRILEVRTLITAAQARAKDYETLKAQFQDLKTAFQQITGLGKDFQGKGADAIKQFYRAQADVVDTWLDLVDQQIAYYRSIPGAINKKHLDEQTSVQVPFLEDDLATGYYRSKEMITQQREAVGKILSRISDLVPLTLFSNHAVDQALDQAEDERRKMATDVRELDQHLTAEYQKATEGLPRVASLYGELIHATRQGADVQPMHFNAEAFHASKAYQLYNEGQKQREARMEKEAEASLPFDLKLKLMENKIERGIGQGLIDTVKDTALGIIETVQHPIQTSVGIYDALSNWNLTSALLAQSISDSYERNMVHGDAYTRSRWITYAVATIVTSVIGTKGIDKVGKAADVAKLGSLASGTATKVGKVAGEWTQVKVNQAAFRVSGKMSHFEMPRLGPEPVLAGGDYLPYHNVVNTAGIKAKLAKIAKGNRESSFFDQINHVENFIQSTSTKKIREISEGTSKVRKENSEVKLKNYSLVTPEMESKILEGQRISNSNRIKGGHSSIINNNNPKFAVETLKVNSDGTRDIQYTKQFFDGNISKLKKSTIFPENWSDTKIIDSIKRVGGSKPIGVRPSDGATLHRLTVDSVQIEVIKIGDNITSGYPTGGGSTGMLKGFSQK